MTSSTQSTPPSPSGPAVNLALISIGALGRALSPERLAAYRDAAQDRDDTDGVARYLWNMALGLALGPALHALEITFRNEITRAARQVIKSDKRQYAVDRIPSWLDSTTPKMLLPNEASKVDKAKMQLGTGAKSCSEGHLIAKLNFGFWVALCSRGYNDTRADGPRIWPRALGFTFQHHTRAALTRENVWSRFDSIRQYRNRVAHHEPLWDRGYLAQHELILESVGWMVPKLETALRAMSSAQAVFAAGPAAFRADAETLLGTGPGRGAILSTRIGALSPDRRDLVESLLNELSAAPVGPIADTIEAWAAKVTGSRVSSGVLL